MKYENSICISDAYYKHAMSAVFDLEIQHQDDFHEKEKHNVRDVDGIDQAVIPQHNRVSTQHFGLR